jgi:hypothetical protein
MNTAVNLQGVSNVLSVFICVFGGCSLVYCKHMKRKGVLNIN